MEGLITKYYIRLFLLLLGLVVVVSQVTKGCTATTRQTAENCTVARVQVQRVFKGSVTIK